MENKRDECVARIFEVDDDTTGGVLQFEISNVCHSMGTGQQLAQIFENGSR